MPRLGAVRRWRNLWSTIRGTIELRWWERNLIDTIRTLFTDGALVSIVKAVSALQSLPGMGPRDGHLRQPGCGCCRAIGHRSLPEVFRTLRRSRGRVDVVVVGAGLKPALCVNGMTPTSGSLDSPGQTCL